MNHPHPAGASHASAHKPRQHEICQQALTYRLAVRLSLPPLVAGVTTMTVALSTDLVAGATMGLEGGLYTALLLGVILLCDVTTGWRSPLLAVAVVALAATRPEGIVVGSALMIVRLFLPSFRLQRDRLVTSIVAFGGVGALELVRFQSRIRE